MEKYGKNETYVSLTGEILTLEDLKHISELKKLSVMWLQSCQIQDGKVLRKINDEDLDFFRDLIKMETLSITYSDITDEGLSRISNLKKLKTLNLNFSKVMGFGLTSISELTNLETIWLRGSLLSDENLKHFELFPKLTTALLQDSNVTLNGLYSLAKLPHLNTAEGGIFTSQHINELRKRQVEFVIDGASVNKQSEPEILELISNFMHQITEIEENLEQLSEKEDTESLKIEQYKKFNSVFDEFCDDKAERRYKEYGCDFQFFTYKRFIPLGLHQVTKSKIHAYYADHSTVRFELVLKNGAWKLLSLQGDFDKRWKRILL